MIRTKGEIIAVVGAPASGKSSLIRSLKKNHKLEVFMEGEEKDFPGFVKNNIRQNINGLQTIIFFHNHSIKQYVKALELRDKGKTVLLDAFWFCNFFYVNVILKNKNEKLMINKLIYLTSRILPGPDIILYLQASDKIIKSRLTSRGRKFEKDFLIRALKVNKEHNKFFKGNKFKKYFTSTQVFKIKADKYSVKQVAQKLRL